MDGKWMRDIRGIAQARSMATKVTNWKMRGLRGALRKPFLCCRNARLNWENLPAPVTVVSQSPIRKSTLANYTPHCPHYTLVCHRIVPHLWGLGVWCCPVIVAGVVVWFLFAPFWTLNILNHSLFAFLCAPRSEKVWDDWINRPFRLSRLHRFGRVFLTIFSYGSECGPKAEDSWGVAFWTAPSTARCHLHSHGRRRDGLDVVTGGVCATSYDVALQSWGCRAQQNLRSMWLGCEHAMNMRLCEHSNACGAKVARSNACSIAICPQVRVLCFSYPSDSFGL